MSDVPCDLELLKLTLVTVQAVDATGGWISGKDVLVFTGDLVDRGPDSKGVLELVQSLAKDALFAGGRVIQILGNHEIMSMRGRTRYVHRDDFRSFGGKSGRVNAFSRDHMLGARLRCLGLVATVGDDLFVHAGLEPEFASPATAAEINKGARELLAQDAFKNDLFRSHGPVWTRLLANGFE